MKKEEPPINQGRRLFCLGTAATGLCTAAGISPARAFVEIDEPNAADVPKRCEGSAIEEACTAAHTSLVKIWPNQAAAEKGGMNYLGSGCIMQ